VRKTDDHALSALVPVEDLDPEHRARPDAIVAVPARASPRREGVVAVVRPRCAIGTVAIPRSSRLEPPPSASGPLFTPIDPARAGPPCLHGKDPLFAVGKKAAAPVARAWRQCPGKMCPGKMCRGVPPLLPARGASRARGVL